MVWNKHEHNRECDGIFIFVFLSKNKWTWIDIIIIRRHYSIWNGSAMIWFWLLQSADLFTLTRCVNCRCWGSWRTLHGKMVTFSNKCCNNIPRCLSSWWRWGQCPGWRGRPCTGSRHPAPPAHAGQSGGLGHGAEPLAADGSQLAIDCPKRLQLLNGQPHPRYSQL